MSVPMSFIRVGAALDGPELLEEVEEPEEEAGPVERANEGKPERDPTNSQ